jgi:hypothetical protein
MRSSPKVLVLLTVALTGCASDALLTREQLRQAGADLDYIRDHAPEYQAKLAVVQTQGLLVALPADRKSRLVLMLPGDTPASAADASSEQIALLGTLDACYFVYQPKAAIGAVRLSCKALAAEASRTQRMQSEETIRAKATLAALSDLAATTDAQAKGIDALKLSLNKVRDDSRAGAIILISRQDTLAQALNLLLKSVREQARQVQVLEKLLSENGTAIGSMATKQTEANARVEALTKLVVDIQKANQVAIESFKVQIEALK